ncbi:SDR family oxidoreductase [Ferrovibrio sp.]|uniref:SDR family oxidoreductase n=1 Tax=Ferrovibrio sp. TaxID=1917215 RepID=UPI00391DE468
MAFDLSGRTAVITGGAGLLGQRHAAAVAEMGATPILVDSNITAARQIAEQIAARYGVAAAAYGIDITDSQQVDELAAELRARGNVDILINNAARNPKVEDGNINFSRLENFPLSEWQNDIAVGLTGAFLLSRTFGEDMARQGKGVILNVASDLAVIAPDQRLYRKDGVPETQQPVKPVTYSVVKAGLIGLTRYLSTYWINRGVRCNAISPGGVYAGQDEVFLSRIEQLIPLGRMAHRDEYKAAIVFLVSDASSYMNGANLIVDGGRTSW